MIFAPFVFIALCACVGALLGHALLGLTVGLAIVFAASVSAFNGRL